MEAHFRVFSDRAASDLEAFEWNSTMDLLACLTAPPDSTMSIYRLLSEDQSPKLLAEKITGVGTSLAWSPCGRRLVVGDRLGGITMFDGETGAVLHSRRSHSAPIAALCWTDGKYIIDEPAWSRMLPPLLTVPSAPSNILAETPSKEEDLKSSSFTILASVDEAGHVVLAAGGTFPVQAQDLQDEGQLQHLRGKPRAAQLSGDLRCLAVLLEGSAPRTSEHHEHHEHQGLRQGQPEGNLAVLVMDVRKLAIRRKELAQCSAMAERFCTVANYTQQAVDTLATVWRSAASSFINKIRALTDCIEAYAGAGTRTTSRSAVQSELLFTLCTGNPSDPVHAFLTRQTTPQQLSRISKSLSQALDYVKLVTCSRLQVAVQHMLTILQELKGCAAWSRFASIGLDLACLETLESRLLQFSAVTEQLLKDCSNVRRFVRTLCQLLLYQAQKLSESNEPSGTPSSRPDPANCTAPSPADVEDFARGASLDLAEVTMRIGKVADAKKDLEDSLAVQVAHLVSSAKCLGESLCSKMAEHSCPLLCKWLSVSAPWCHASPELRAVASADAASNVPSPRGLGRPMVHFAWEDLSGELSQGDLTETLPQQLLLLWCGEAQLHVARIRLEVGALGTSVQPTTRFANLKVRGGHFLLCRCYDASHAAVLILEEEPPTATVGLLDLEALESSGAEEASDLPKDALRRSAPLPESYVWASAMRSMSQRGVCSIYSWRARRLLTLDMEACDDDMDEAD